MFTKYGGHSSIRPHALQALVGNQLLHLPKENGKVQYRGTWVTESQAPDVVKSDLHRLFQKDRRMSASEIKEWSKSHYPRPRNSTPTANRGRERVAQFAPIRTILKPLPPGTKRFLEGEHAFGPRSDEQKYPPIKIPRMDAKTAYTTFYTGQGQSYQVPFSSIEFRSGTFDQDSQFIREVSKLAKKAQKQGIIVTKDINLPNQGFTFEDKSKDEAWVYGYISVNAKGELLVDAKGSWEFSGTLFPALVKDDTTGEIYRGDRFNFNPQPFGVRSWEGEAAVRFFHNTPGSSYKIYFTNESVKVRLSNWKN